MQQEGSKDAGLGLTAQYRQQHRAVPCHTDSIPCLSDSERSASPITRADQYQLVACECAQALHGVPYTLAM